MDEGNLRVNLPVPMVVEPRTAGRFARSLWSGRLSLVSTVSEMAAAGVPRPVVGEVDGVRSVTLSRPDQITSASLVFASGTADERPWQRHGLHLLEHLVTAELRELPAEVDASVGIHTTTFEVSARPEAVRALLEWLCRLLVDPPLDRMAVEAQVLAVEGGLNVDVGPVEAIADARYGHTGAGVLGLAEPHPSRLTETTLRELAARCFRRDLAQLLLIGAPVAELCLPLRDESPAQRGWRAHRPVPGPTVVLGEVPRLGVSLVHPGDDPVTAYVCQEALERRVTEVLRHRHGWSYDITTNLCLGAGEICDILHLDVAEARIGEAGRLFRDVVTDFLEHGPSDEEVEAAAKSIEIRSLRPLSFAHYEIEAGLDLRAGLPPALRGMDTVAATTGEQVRAWLRAVRSSVLWYAPQEDEDSWREAGWAVFDVASPPSEPTPGTRPLRTPRLARLLSRDDRAAQLVIGPDSVTEHRRHGTLHIRDQDVVAVISDPLGDERRLLVASSDGSTIELGDSAYPGSSAVLDRIKANVGPHVFYKTKPREAEAQPRQRTTPA